MEHDGCDRCRVETIGKEGEGVFATKEILFAEGRRHRKRLKQMRQNVGEKDVIIEMY